MDGRKIFGLNKNVFFLGLASLFNDFSNEMIQSVMTLFLASFLGATAVIAIGIIEGLSDAFASVVKIISGAISDRTGRRKSIAVLGYALSVATRPFLALASKFGHVLALRMTDRLGKGLRDSPRDALLASSVVKEDLGLSFGYQRAMDALGGLLGPLAAVIIFPLLAYNYSHLFFVSFAVGILALLGFFFVKEIRGPGATPSSERLKENLFKAHRHFKLLLITVFVFGLGTLPITLMLFRVVELHLDNSIVPLLYFIHGLIFTLASMPLGRLSDRIGETRVMIGGFIMAIAAYLILALTDSISALFMSFILLGLYAAATDGIERALTAKLIRHELLGVGEGTLQASVGISSLFAGIIGGLLWFYFGHLAAFVYVSSVSLIGLGLLLFINHRHRI